MGAETALLVPAGRGKLMMQLAEASRERDALASTLQECLDAWNAPESDLINASRITAANARAEQLLAAHHARTRDTTEGRDGD